MGWNDLELEIEVERITETLDSLQLLITQQEERKLDLDALKHLEDYFILLRPRALELTTRFHNMKMDKRC